MAAPTMVDYFVHYGPIAAAMATALALAALDVTLFAFPATVCKRTAAEQARIGRAVDQPSFDTIPFFTRLCLLAGLLILSLLVALYGLAACLVQRITYLPCVLIEASLISLLGIDVDQFPRHETRSRAGFLGTVAFFSSCLPDRVHPGHGMLLSQMPSIAPTKIDFGIYYFWTGLGLALTCQTALLHGLHDVLEYAAGMDARLEAILDPSSSPADSLRQKLSYGPWK